MEGESELAFRTVLFIGTFGMLSLAIAIVVFIYAYQRRLIKKKLEFQEIESLLTEQELKSTYAMLEGQDLERKRIAKELHDGLGSILVTLNMYADTAFSTTDIEKKNDLITKLKNVAVKASDQTRELSHELDSVPLQHFGLKLGLEDLLQVVTETKPIKVYSNIKIDDSLNGDISFNIYRIVQELVNNTLKHAKASEISLELTTINNEYLSLIYADNGIGYDETKVAKGMGILNIKSRVDKINGILSLSNKPVGSSIIIEIPLTL